MIALTLGDGRMVPPAMPSLSIAAPRAGQLSTPGANQICRPVGPLEGKSVASPRWYIG